MGNDRVIQHSIVKYPPIHGRRVCEITLSARCYPTEDRDKVAGAMRSLFPDAVVQGDDPLVAVSKSIGEFSEQLTKQRIRAAARKVLIRGIAGDEIGFRLNKQVATMGKISFSEEDHALGDIEVTISSSDPRGFIDRLIAFARTEDES